MATLGGYAQRQSQTASAADTTLQALMMLMQYQQQAEDRRLSREQMMLQNEQLQGLLRAQQRDELESQPRVSTVRTLEQVFTQGDYAALEEVLKSSELYMQNPEVVFGETAVTDVPSAFVRGLGEDPSTQDYATLATELTNRYERLERFVRSTEIPKDEQDEFLNGMKDRINSLMKTPEGEKFKKGIISKTIQSGVNEGSMFIEDTDNADFMRGVLKTDPLFGDQNFSGTLSFLPDIALGAIQQSRTPTIQSLQNTVAGIEDEDMQETAASVLENPDSLNEILASPDPRSALFNKLGDMPEAEPGFFERVGQVGSDIGSYVADNPATVGVGGYGAYKGWKWLRALQNPGVPAFIAPVLKAVAAAELPTRVLQELGIIPEVEGRRGVLGTLAGLNKAGVNLNNFFGGETEAFKEGGDYSDAAEFSAMDLVGAALGLDTIDAVDEETVAQAKNMYRMQQQLNLDRYLAGEQMGPEGLPPVSQLSPLVLPDTLLPEPAQPFSMFPPEAYGSEDLGPPAPPATLSPIQGPMQQPFMDALQALEAKAAQEALYQQGLLEAGIEPMGETPIGDKLANLVGPTAYSLDLDAKQQIESEYNNIAEGMSEEQKTQLLEAAYPMDYLRSIASGDSPAVDRKDPTVLNEEMAADLPTPELRREALKDLAMLSSLYKVTGNENTLDDLYSSDYNNPAMVKADISRMMRGFTQAQQDLQTPAGPLLMPSVTGQSLQDQIGAEEYLRALAISQQQQQQEELLRQQSLMSLMNQPLMLE